ncbi:FecR domain-containing protein [Caulobacter segnis]|uniref:FecR family protein n=1 Tax=Caulobacter segnis TaxID=88688 RepID=UPI00240FB551|nr:FecR domain-containing protein [Caulobacter segnis]MDG2523006.1 FecR domain-containing protein [Caulobacter segnis]
MASARPTPQMVLEAAQWAAELDADRPSAKLRAACEAWCAADPLQRLAFERMRAANRPFDDLGDAQRQVISSAARTRPTRRLRVLPVAMLVLGAGAAWFAAQSFTVRQHFPDHATSRGEIRNVALADGSRLVLDTETAVGVQGRTIDLYRGQVMATVAPSAGKPFVVRVPEGTAMALGTIFSVQRQSNGALVTVLKSQVRVCPAHGDARACRILRPGERARILSDRIEPLQRVSIGRAQAWTHGWLEADETPLAEIAHELGRYSDRTIRLADEPTGQITVTGSYQLRDPSRTLRAIAKTHGLRFEQTPRQIELSAR